MSIQQVFWAQFRDRIFRLNHFLAMISGWLVLLITLICCYGVYTRYVLGTPDTWSYPVCAYLLCFVVFFATSHALQEGIHVRIDLLQEWFPGKATRIATTIGDILTTIFLSLFFYQVWKVFFEGYSTTRIDETELAWPVALVQWSMPFGAGLMFITQLLVIAARFIDGRELPHQDSW